VVDLQIVAKWMEYIRNNPDNAYRFTENFYQSQIDSKKWLIKHIPTDVGSICIFGGWHGLLAQYIAESFPAVEILTTDIDSDCQSVFNQINTNIAISFRRHDMSNGMHVFMPSPDLVINTSTEHVTQDVYDAWWELIPAKTKYIVQGNNLDHPEHIRIADNLEQFLELNRIKDPEYAGMLKCGHFYRFMATGVR
jgi:hypothetical protein